MARGWVLPFIGKFDTTKQQPGLEREALGNYVPIRGSHYVRIGKFINQHIHCINQHIACEAMPPTYI